eukprot:159914-Chlamydomonas_euryale.AAC.3
MFFKIQARCGVTDSGDPTPESVFFFRSTRRKWSPVCTRYSCRSNAGGRPWIKNSPLPPKRPPPTARTCRLARRHRAPVWLPERGARGRVRLAGAARPRLPALTGGPPTRTIVCAAAGGACWGKNMSAHACSPCFCMLGQACRHARVQPLFFMLRQARGRERM